MKTKITPRGKYIFVRPDDEESRQSESGIIKPDTEEQERKSVGTVLAVGPDIKDVEVGRRVVFGTYAGDTIKLREDGKEVDHKLLHDDDVLAFVDETDENDNQS